MEGSMASIHIGLVEVRIGESGGKSKERMLHEGTGIGAKTDCLGILSDLVVEARGENLKSFYRCKTPRSCTDSYLCEIQ